MQQILNVKMLNPKHFTWWLNISDTNTINIENYEQYIWKNAYNLTLQK